ncbi:nuclear pore protein 84/107 [Hysterangium stoloniferum]|nr:nuclear pore protein 84/107 [Hysterangium stoloniferum]
MSNTLYTSYAHVYYSFKESDSNHRALNNVDGFAPRLRNACQKALHDAQSHGRISRENAEDIDALKLERDTWDLLQNMYGARKAVRSDLKSPNELLQENPYVTPNTLVNHLVHNSPALTELLVTREWLQDNAPSPQIIESATAYRNFTRLSMIHNQRLGEGGARVNLVKELDPDVLIRESGSVIAAEDAAYEKALAHSLYTYIRAGQSDHAMDVCRSAHRPWLAAVLQGYKLYDWTAICTYSKEDDAMYDDSVAEVTGNKRRRLWKKSCTAAALDNHMPIPERILNAALAPSRKTLGVLVKEACKTWEDHLWARVATLLEEKVSEGLILLGPNFWERNGKGVHEANVISKDGNFEGGTIDETREVLSKMADLNVEEGPGAGDPFHVTQLRVILDQADSLLEDFAVYLGSPELPRNSYEYTRLTRFFAHLCLFFNHIDVPISPLASQKILEAYVTVLEQQGQTDLIAQYVAALGDNAVSRYALFLAEIPVSASFHERRDTLFRAQEFGLNVAHVALSTADICIERAFKALPKPSTPYPFIASDPKQLTDSESALINSIDWLGFQEETYRTAVVRYNSVIRYFLCTGNLHACHELRERRPVVLRDDPPGESTDRYEYLHLERFFIAWAALGLATHYATELTRPTSNAQSRQGDTERYGASLRKAREQILDLLTNSWLQTEQITEDIDNIRSAELMRIREMYVPELIIRLHRALYESRRLVPHHIKSALLLANTVSDSRFELYEAFQNPHGNRLGEYLQNIKEAVLGSLENGGSDPFRVVAA